MENNKNNQINFFVDNINVIFNGGTVSNIETSITTTPINSNGNISAYPQNILSITGANYFENPYPQSSSASVLDYSDLTKSKSDSMSSIHPQESMPKKSETSSSADTSCITKAMWFVIITAAVIAMLLHSANFNIIHIDNICI